MITLMRIIAGSWAFFGILEITDEFELPGFLQIARVASLFVEGMMRVLA